MMNPQDPQLRTEVETAALEAWRRGYIPIPIIDGGKRPAISSWSRQAYEEEADVLDTFRAAREEKPGIGLLLGSASMGLADVDIDLPIGIRVARHVLPDTAMVTGRTSSPRSHFWFSLTDEEPDGTRRYTDTEGQVIIELRYTGSQTIIPPSIHPSKESYRWEGEPFGGEEGPARVRGKVLRAKVALVAMIAVAVDGWPKQGSRHDAYLALAGGLLRYGADGENGAIHPQWEISLPDVIRIIADLTHDEDGPNARASEVMNSTLERLRAGGKASGFPTLTRLIGQPHAELIRKYAREIESILGQAVRPTLSPIEMNLSGPDEEEDPGEKAQRLALMPIEERRPLEERNCSWEPVDLAPYLDGDVKSPQPTILRRQDGLGLFYPGRVNSLYGASESGKTWITFAASKEAIEDGQHVLFIDCEDDPGTAILRMRLLGCASDDLRQRFTYLHPEGPIAPLSRNNWGEPNPSALGQQNYKALMDALASVEPDLIVVDGLTVLYGLHGLNTNDASNTEVITGFMRSLTKGGERTVIIIDHTGKGIGRGGTPMGSIHKIAMIQGSAIQVVPIERPRPGFMGELDLVVGKDRPGVVRGASAGTGDNYTAAVVKMDARVEGRMVLTVEVPPDAPALIIGDSDEMSERLTQLAEDSERIMVVLRKAIEPLSRKEIEIAIKPNRISDARWKRAVGALKSDGEIEMVGGARASKYSLRRI